MSRLLAAINPRLTRFAGRRALLIGRAPKTPVATDAPRGPDWVQADPHWIGSALARAQARDSGGWYVAGAREAFGGRGPYPLTVLGQALVLWRNAAGRLVAAPEACPHMGASLTGALLEEGRLVCPWHGLRLDERGFREWRCHPVHDDGVLVWVRLPTPGESASEAPTLAPRPSGGVAGVITAIARCDPQDVIANRLDPWHGAHYHPHSFGGLEVLERSLELIRLRVVYKVAGPVGVEVDATFHCPDARTIVMTIIDGDGVGSVVETHATPIGPGQSLLVEASIATSDRPYFSRFVRGLPLVARGLVKPLLEARARRLWVEDIAYAERRYALRMAHAMPRLVPPSLEGGELDGRRRTP